MEVAYQLELAGRSRGMGLSRYSRQIRAAQGRNAFILPLRCSNGRLISAASYSGLLRLGLAGW